MADVILKVQMRKGTGFGVWVTVDGKTSHFTESGEVTLDLVPQYYVATVGGQEPTTATVIISFSQDGTLLAEEEYQDPIFFGFIPFEVK